MLYKFERENKATEETKNICCVAGEDAVDHNTVNRYFKKFRSGCKTSRRSGKVLDSEAVLRAIEANPVSSSQRVSGENSISQ